MIPLINHDSSVRSQWDRCNLPRFMMPYDATLQIPQDFFTSHQWHQSLDLQRLILQCLHFSQGGRPHWAPRGSLFVAVRDGRKNDAWIINVYMVKKCDKIRRRVFKRRWLQDQTFFSHPPCHTMSMSSLVWMKHAFFLRPHFEKIFCSQVAPLSSVILQSPSLPRSPHMTFALL